MNPQDQNQNNNYYPNQPGPQLSNNPNQQNTRQLPRAYAPRQYQPYLSDNKMPENAPPKNNKKLIVIFVIVGVALILTIVLAVLMNIKKNPALPARDSSNAFSRRYDSPVGLTAGMQGSDIKSGNFKIRASYVGDGDFTREGTFVVGDDGKMHFSMIPDGKRVNETLKQLYDRQPGDKEAFDVTKNGVSDYFSYDFLSIAGFNYLYEASGDNLSGFIPDVETAKAASSRDKRYTLTTSCDSALSEVKKRTDMNTSSLSFEITGQGINKQKAKINFSTMESIDKSISTFFDNCYDLNSEANAELKKFVEKQKKDVTTSPEFYFWQENGVNYLEVGGLPENTPFDGGLYFELTKLSTSPAEITGTTAPYLLRRNQFALALSLCRTDPVVTRGEKEGYRFLLEDPEYSYPDRKDTGYYCTTLKVPPQYVLPKSISLKSTTGSVSEITATAIDGLRGFHDLAYEIERFNLENKRFPGSIEFRDMASSSMGSLTAVTQARFLDRSLSYTALPSTCTSTCSDFALGFVVVPNVQLQRSTYLLK